MRELGTKQNSELWPWGIHKSMHLHFSTFAKVAFAISQTDSEHIVELSSVAKYFWNHQNKKTNCQHRLAHIFLSTILKISSQEFLSLRAILSTPGSPHLVRDHLGCSGRDPGKAQRIESERGWCGLMDSNAMLLVMLKSERSCVCFWGPMGPAKKLFLIWNKSAATSLPNWESKSVLRIKGIINFATCFWKRQAQPDHVRYWSSSNDLELNRWTRKPCEYTKNVKESSKRL